MAENAGEKEEATISERVGGSESESESKEVEDVSTGRGSLCREAPLSAGCFSRGGLVVIVWIDLRAESCALCCA